MVLKTLVSGATGEKRLGSHAESQSLAANVLSQYVAVVGEGEHPRVAFIILRQ